MKILVLNCGSSSLKYKVFDGKEVIAQGGVEKIGLPDSFLKLTDNEGHKVIVEHFMLEHTAAVEFVFSEHLLNPKYGVLKSADEIQAVGHRVLHGAMKVTKSSLVTDELIDIVKECSVLGPLHNPANLKGIMAVKQLMPNVPQVAVFDTAFHQTMPEKAYMYAIPYEMFEKWGVRRYGFHGTSHRFVSKRTIEYLGLNPNNSKLIVAHVGNGASMSAVVNGKCVDTTMGLTPLEGLVMGTRSGDIDAAAVTFMMEKEGMTPAQMDTMLNKKSGMLGMCGCSDMRDAYQKQLDGDKKAKMALDVYCYRLKKYIGAYAAAMGGVDAIAFTGGVGENHNYVREQVCKDLEFLGIKLDADKNVQIHGDEAIISAADSKVTVAVIPTDEELMIATDTEDIVSAL
ncbi:MAG: acetate kinase [Bacteroidales bacterium]|nr:acetate kinase [Bacteroidales bacterium]